MHYTKFYLIENDNIAHKYSWYCWQSSRKFLYFLADHKNGQHFIVPQMADR